MKILIVVILSLTLIGCGEYKPPTPELISFMVNTWNIFFAVGYISLLLSVVIKRFNIIGFSSIYLLAVYSSFTVFGVFSPDFNLTLGLPF